MTSSVEQKYKADAGKPHYGMVLKDMAQAIRGVVAVLEYGAQKYERSSWKQVVTERYDEAQYRHMMDQLLGEERDDESGLLHIQHEACNALFRLQQYLEANPDVDYTSFKEPPTKHKEA